MQKKFFSVKIEGNEKASLFVNRDKAAEFGKPETHKVELSTFNAMLANGDFEDEVPTAEVIEDSQETTGQQEQEQTTPTQIATQEQEKIRTILETLKAQVEALQVENKALKNKRLSFSDLLKLNERRETVINHISRFEEGREKLEYVQKELNPHNELDEPEFISLFFVKTNRHTREAEHICSISDALTLGKITDEALKHVENRIEKLETEKAEIETKL